MFKIIKIVVLFVLLTAYVSIPAAAQSAEDVLRYSLEYPGYDPQSLVMPSVSNNTGFGSFQENPAVMALFRDNFGSLSLSGRTVEEETSFQQSLFEFSDGQADIGDLGLVYSIPTVRGSLVVGGGYSQTSNFNRALGISLHNDRSSLTDEYNMLEGDLNDAAFNVYAIDWADLDSTYTQSIFRIGYDAADWPGVQQNMELTERGRMGEYSAFLATEFQKGLYFGVSIGLLVGDYNYERQFLESDPQNMYDGSLIDSDGDGAGETDIDRVLSVDTIDASFTSFSARVGMLYQVTEYFSIGGSYEIPSVLSFTEDYNTLISSTFDNGEGFDEDLPGSYDYKIERPSRISVGATLRDIGGATLSLSAERVDYSSSKLDLGGADLDYQQVENRFIADSFREVTNLRAGLSYRFPGEFTPRVGYAYYPSARETGASTAREFYSAGFSARVSEYLWFDLGVRYVTWQDQNRLYGYDVAGGPQGGAVVDEDIRKIDFMAGLRIAL